MKTYARIIAIAGFALLTGVSPARAQYNTVVAKVPFEFKIGAINLPRDIYHVSRVDGHTNVVLVRSPRHGAFLLGQSIGSMDGGEVPRLVFHRYDHQYFLREIRFLGSVGLSLPETPDEREAAEQQAHRVTSNVEIVAVVAQLQ